MDSSAGKKAFSAQRVKRKRENFCDVVQSTGKMAHKNHSRDMTQQQQFLFNVFLYATCTLGEREKEKKAIDSKMTTYSKVIKLMTSAIDQFVVRWMDRLIGFFFALRTKLACILKNPKENWVSSWKYRSGEWSFDEGKISLFTDFGVEWMDFKVSIHTQNFFGEKFPSHLFFGRHLKAYGLLPFVWKESRHFSSPLL